MVKKQTACGVKDCGEEFKTMSDLYQHQAVKHIMLTTKYKCNVDHHSHISAESRRKCLNRNTTKVPKVALWRAKKNEVKGAKNVGV